LCRVPNKKPAIEAPTRDRDLVVDAVEASFVSVRRTWISA
jgi:hypothetical protein